MLFCHVISPGCKVCTSNPGHLTIFSQFFCNIFVQAICTEYCIAHYQISRQDPSCTNLTDTLVELLIRRRIGRDVTLSFTYSIITLHFDILSRPPKLHWNTKGSAVVLGKTVCWGSAWIQTFECKRFNRDIFTHLCWLYCKE